MSFDAGWTEIKIKMRVKHTLCDLIKTNLEYIKSEAYDFATMHLFGYSTTLYLNHLDVSDELNATLTFAAKTAGFFVGKLSGHKREKKKVFRSNVIGSSIVALGPIGHWVSLKTHFVPDYLAYFVGYGIPGVTGTGIRWYMDAKSGLIRILRKPDDSEPHIF